MNDSISTFDTAKTSIEILDSKNEDKIIKNTKKKKNHQLLKILIFISFTLLGFINHLGYYLIITSSQQFATKLGNESLIACYPLALIVFSSFTRILNSKYCINLSYFIRVIALAIYFCMGYLSLFFILQSANLNKNNNRAFWLTMIPTTIVGTAESFGEVTILGYAGTFRGNYISGWNIGSAFAGVSGSFLSLLFKRLETNLKYVYLFLSPVAVLYLFIFMLIHLCGYKERKNYILKQKYNKMQEEKSQNIPINNKIEFTNNNIEINKKDLNIKNLKDGFKLSYRYIINLSLINFLQYTICYCFCERANKYKYIKSKGTIFESIQYEALLLFFEFGVVISNSFLSLIKHIKNLEIFTYLQLLNFVLWFFESLFGFISNQWVCYIHLFFVGICGGAGNIGFLYSMFNSKKISQRFQELCLNICEFFMDWGILISSITSIIFDNTFMKLNERI
jgi:hypothetical protein